MPTVEVDQEGKKVGKRRVPMALVMERESLKDAMEHVLRPKAESQAMQPMSRF